MACTEPTDIGERCSADESIVTRVLQPSSGENRIALDVSFERCFQFLCVSVNGNEPYCTQRCVRGDDCPAGYECVQPIEFGPLSRVCEGDTRASCEPASYCVKAVEWDSVGQQSEADAGP